MNSLAQDDLLITFKNWVLFKQLLSYKLQEEYSEKYGMKRVSV